MLKVHQEPTHRIGIHAVAGENALHILLLVYYIHLSYKATCVAYAGYYYNTIRIFVNRICALCRRPEGDTKIFYSIL